MQLTETRLRRCGTLEFTILLFKRKPQNVIVLSLEPADGMVRAIPFYIHTTEVNQNLPPKNQRSKVPTRAPLSEIA